MIRVLYLDGIPRYDLRFSKSYPWISLSNLTVGDLVWIYKPITLPIGSYKVKGFNIYPHKVIKGYLSCRRKGSLFTRIHPHLCEIQKLDKCNNFGDHILLKII